MHRDLEVYHGLGVTEGTDDASVSRHKGRPADYNFAAVRIHRIRYSGSRLKPSLDWPSTALIRAYAELVTGAAVSRI